MYTNLTMNPSQSFDNHTVEACRTAEQSPRHAYRKTSNGYSGGQHSYFLGGSDESPTCVFAASFDEQQQRQQHQSGKDASAQLQHHLSRMSFDEVHMDDAFDYEIAMSYTSPDDSIPQAPPQVVRTTSVARSTTMSVDSSRPSDPIARLLLSK